MKDKKIGYTLGFKESYDKYLNEPGPHIKMGKGSPVEGYEDYPGGTVWKTKEEAEEYKKINPGYDIYLIQFQTNWDDDTYLTESGLYSLNKDCTILPQEE